MSNLKFRGLPDLFEQLIDFIEAQFKPAPVPPEVLEQLNRIEGSQRRVEAAVTFFGVQLAAGLTSFTSQLAQFCGNEPGPATQEQLDALGQRIVDAENQVAASDPNADTQTKEQ